ncbi:MAG: MFS transporter [Drouetiella hepatica Uher 2000/2452]|uniref:MFS transporter n=1 Tax=Drouetiella hepatica Uher 2000/2452 TaxID=904376 RepID=A0A951QB98_9CYAN|nr:MFS transporter [Drouetiella hepatica Uher 2000/2452]
MSFGKSFRQHRLGLSKTSSSKTSLPGKRSAYAIAFVGFCSFLNLYATQPLLPLFTQIFHASEVEVSLTVSATTIAVALSAPWAGVLADRMGRKRMIVPALLLLSLFTGLTATATGLDALLGWRFMQGLLMAAVFAVSIAYVSEEWAGAGVGAAMAIYVTGNVLGGFSGRVLSGFVTDTLGWRWAFVLLSGLTLLGAIASWLWLPSSRNFTGKKNIRSSLQAMALHLRNPHLIAAYAVGFNILFSSVAIFTYVNFYLSAAPFNLNTVALGLVFCVYLLGVVITPIAGRWIERLGYRRSLMLAIGMICVGISITLIPQLWMVIVGLAVSASGIFVCQSVTTSYVGTTARESRSAATGLYVSAYYVGGSLGAVLPGFFWNLGQWKACVLLILAIQGMTAGVAIASWKK